MICQMETEPQMVLAPPPLQAVAAAVEGQAHSGTVTLAQEQCDMRTPCNLQTGKVKGSRGSAGAMEPL